MKLRLNQNSIRLRLSQSNVESLSKTKQVISHIDFQDEIRFSYRLSIGLEFQAEFIIQGISVTIPSVAAKNWIDSEELSLEGFILLTNGEKLRILIEKDLKCLTDRPFENEEDLFPNPNQSC